MPSQGQILSDMELANDYFVAEWPTPGCSSCLPSNHPSQYFGRAGRTSRAPWRCTGSTSIRRSTPTPKVGQFLQLGAVGQRHDRCLARRPVLRPGLHRNVPARYHAEPAPDAYHQERQFLGRQFHRGALDVRGRPAHVHAGVRQARLAARGHSSPATPPTFRRCIRISITQDDARPVQHHRPPMVPRRDVHQPAISPRMARRKKCYWSRGNGWAFAALARVLDVLPTTDAHYAEYVQTFQNMAAAIAATQRTDGFWNVNLAYANDYPGPESTGTALFVLRLRVGHQPGAAEHQTRTCRP